MSEQTQLDEPSTDHEAPNPVLDELRNTPDSIVVQIEAAAMEFYRREQLDRAREVLEKLVFMRPTEATYWTLLGVIFRRKDKRGASLRCLRKAAQLAPEDRNTLVNLGEVLVEVGKVPEGIDLLEAVFSAGHDPQLPPDEQDPITIRAGAELQFIGELLEEYIEVDRRRPA